MMKEQERVVFVDYVRVVAPLLVMLVHASENFYAADASGLAGSVSELACESNRFWVAFWDGGVSRYCVPLFMMISAYLLVPMRAGQTMGRSTRGASSTSCLPSSCSSWPIRCCPYCGAL